MSNVLPRRLLAALILLAAPAQALDRPALPDDLRPLRDDTASELVRTAGDGLRAQLRQIDVEEPELRRRLGFTTNRLATEDHGNVVVVRGTEGEFDIDWSNSRNLQNALFEIINAFYRTHPGRNPHFLSVLTTFAVEQPQAFYMPVSNDVRGIGYRHAHGRDTFDSAPGVSVNGIIFLNSFRNYLGRNEPIGRFTFNQELGHRWGAFIHFQTARGTSNALLGRDCAHWSFFTHSQNSSMEGNVWRDNNDGSFTTRTSFFDFGYSQIDRYLMGFAPAEAIDPFFVITGGGQWDCSVPFRNGDYNPAWYPPIFGGAGQRQVSVRGERVDVTIEDIVAAEGPRNPSYENAEKTWSMVFLLAVRQNDRIDDATIDIIDGMRRSLEVQWEADATEPGYPSPNLVTTLDGSNDPVEPGGPGGPDNPGSLGQPCASFDDCDPANATHCVPMRAGVRLCTKLCHASSDCPRSFCCESSVPGDERVNHYCIESDRACPAEPDEPAEDGAGGEPGNEGGAGGMASGGAGGEPAGNGGAAGAPISDDDSLGGAPAGQGGAGAGSGNAGGAPIGGAPAGGAPGGEVGVDRVSSGGGSSGCQSTPGPAALPLLGLLLALRRRR